MAAVRRLKIQSREGVWYLSGDLGADADLSPLLKEEGTLQLNLRNLGEINSVGVRHLCMFLKGFKGTRFEYLECPPNFLDILNMVPMLLAVDEKVGRVVSMNIPYVCSRCYYEQNILTPTQDISQKGSKFSLPTYDCAQCNSEKSLDPAIPAQDLLYFLGDKG